MGNQLWTFRRTLPQFFGDFIWFCLILTAILFTFSFTTKIHDIFFILRSQCFSPWSHTVSQVPGSYPVYNRQAVHDVTRQILSLHSFSQHNLVKPQKSLIFFWSCIPCESSFWTLSLLILPIKTTTQNCPATSGPNSNDLLQLCHSAPVQPQPSHCSPPATIFSRPFPTLIT